MAKNLPAPPALDDRRFGDLVDELLARIPAHTPEWLPQEGDPGRTLIELFAWLGDTILYRANLVPEKQRLAFLNLLGKPLEPAQPASGVVALQLADPAATTSVVVASESLLPAAVKFETTAEVRVFPVQAECYYKRSLSTDEVDALQDVITELKQFHEISDDDFAGYVTELAFAPGQQAQAIDIPQQAQDKKLWIALMAPAAGLVNAVKSALAGESEGLAPRLNIGFSPANEIPEFVDDVSVGGETEYSVSISTGELENDEPVYLQLDKFDFTRGLKQSGIVQVQLPGDKAYFGVPEGDVRNDVNAGLGDRPPRIDDPEKLARIVTWLCVEFPDTVTSAPLKWVDVNAVTVDQRQTIRAQVIGQSKGSANQIFNTPWTAIDKSSLQIQVEETDRGYVQWYRIDDLALVGRDDSAFELDAATGSIHFGNGIYGRIPEAGRRVRIAYARIGGGSKGNLPPASLTQINAKGVDGKLLNQQLIVKQAIATAGGTDGETLAQAEQRIPNWLRHRNRAVVEDDFQQLASETPGVNLGRVEVLPRFLPQQRRDGVPGVVSVMVLPQKEQIEAPNPRIDKPLIEKVYNYLDARKPVGTELYVIGCEYVPLALSVAISLRDGFGQDSVIYEVKQALKKHLWSLAPYGPFNEGWPLGRAVGDRELEVVVARVAGVNGVGGCNLFLRQQNKWLKMPRKTKGDPVELRLDPWQLPELLGVVVSIGDTPLDDVSGLFGGIRSGGNAGTAVPLIPEVC